MANFLFITAVLLGLLANISIGKPVAGIDGALDKHTDQPEKHDTGHAADENVGGASITSEEQDDDEFEYADDDEDMITWEELDLWWREYIKNGTRMGLFSEKDVEDLFGKLESEPEPESESEDWDDDMEFEDEFDYSTVHLVSPWHHKAHCTSKDPEMICSLYCRPDSDVEPLPEGQYDCDKLTEEYGHRNCEVICVHESEYEDLEDEITQQIENNSTK